MTHREGEVLFEDAFKLTPGENEILVRLEVNEPLFGSGFWARAL